MTGANLEPDTNVAFKEVWDIVGPPIPHLKQNHKTAADRKAGNY
jgi:hypothetical protein